MSAPAAWHQLHRQDSASGRLCSQAAAAWVACRRQSRTVQGRRGARDLGGRSQQHESGRQTGRQRERQADEGHVLRRPATLAARLAEGVPSLSDEAMGSEVPDYVQPLVADPHAADYLQPAAREDTLAAASTAISKASVRPRCRPRAL